MQNLDKTLARQKREARVSTRSTESLWEKRLSEPLRPEKAQRAFKTGLR